MGRRVLSRQTISAYSESDSEGEEKEEEDEEDGFIKQPRHNVKEGEEKKKKKRLIISQLLQSGSVQPVRMIRMDLVRDLKSKGST